MYVCNTKRTVNITALACFEALFISPVVSPLGYKSLRL